MSITQDNKPRTEPGNESINPNRNQLQHLSSEIQTLTEHNRFHEAAQLCEKLIADYPNKPAGFVGLTRIAFRQQDYALTLEHCGQWMHNFPDELPFYNFKAEALINLDRLEEAEQLCQLLTDKFPGKPIGFVGLVRIAFKKQNYGVTVDRCEKFLLKLPNELPLLNLKFEALMNLGRLQEAEQTSQIMTEKFPNKPNGFTGLTRVAFKKQDYKLTLENCDKWLPMFASELALLRFKAEALIALSFLDEAERACIALTTHYPDKPVGYLLLARISQQQGYHQTTIERCSRIIALFPNETGTNQILANALIATFQFDKAKNLFHHCIHKHPENPMGYIGLAKVAAQQSQYEAALTLCDKVNELFPSEIDAISLKGNTLIALSRFEEAKTLFEGMVESFPHLTNGYAGLHQLYKRLEKHDPALDAIKAAYAINPKNLWIITQYATQLELMGNLDEAVGLLEYHVNELNHEACLAPLVNLFSKYGNTSKVLELLGTKGEFFLRNDSLRFKVGYALRNKGNLLASYTLFKNYLDTKDIVSLETIKNTFKAYEQIKLFQGIVQNSHAFKNPFFSTFSFPKPNLFKDDRHNQIITLMEAKEFLQCDLLLADLISSTPNCLIAEFLKGAVEYAKKIDFIRSNFADSYLDISTSPQSAIKLSEILINRIQNKTPTSLIRLGDGEGMFLNYPANDKKWHESDKQHSQRVWWGNIKFNKNEDNHITAIFYEALCNADILGIPNLAIMIQNTPIIEEVIHSPSHRGWKAIYHHIGSNEFLDSKLPSTILTTWHCHNDLEFLDLYRYILTNLPSVTVITCHSDIGRFIRDKFGIRSVKTIVIPSEHRHSHNFNTHNQTNNHYPECFNKIMATLAVEAGEVFLVGAGFLGKMYCNEIKKKGGIGFDIGAIADKWVGYTTRDEHEYIHRMWGIDIDIDRLRKAHFPGYQKVKKQQHYRSNYYCDMNIFQDDEEPIAPTGLRSEKILITGHPRCGSNYMSLLFSRLGIEINHEWFGKDGICSWLFAVKDLNMPIFGKQGIEPNASYYTEFDYTLAYVRNPFAAIPSIIVENRHERSYNFRRNHIINELGYDIDEYANDTERAVASFLYWNKIVELKNPMATFKVEDCIQPVVDFLHERKLISKTVDINALDIPTNANSTIALGFTKPELLPSDYAKIANHLKSDLLSFCKRYGYAIPDGF